MSTPFVVADRSYNELDVLEFSGTTALIILTKRLCEEAQINQRNRNFWNHEMRHFRRFNGVPRQQFPLFLKECEWRLNITTSLRQLIQLLKRGFRGILGGRLIIPRIIQASDSWDRMNRMK